MRDLQDIRIASLVPSLTELVVEMGLGAALVARTGFCIHPAPHLDHVPKVGGTKDVNLEKLKRETLSARKSTLRVTYPADIEAATPAIKRATTDPDSSVRAAAGSALRAISP